MTPEEVKLFHTYLSKASVYFEYGCGGSTVLADSYTNISKIYSVESDQNWIANVKLNLANSKSQFFYIDLNAGAWGRPKDESKKDNWPTYSSQMSHISEKPDLVLVDGRFRVACAANAYTHMSDSGVALVHDYERASYHVIEKIYTPIERCDNLVALAKKPNCQSLAIEIYNNHKFMVE